MLSITQLLLTLDYHDRIYNSPDSGNRLALLAAKASILEVCGWVEQAMDLLVNDCATRCGLTEQRILRVEKTYVARTNGFHYTKHFERMLISVIGFKLLEDVENLIPVQITQLQALCGDLTQLRNHYAHTHFDEATPYPSGRISIPDPTTMIANANTAKVGLGALERELINLGL